MGTAEACADLGTASSTQASVHNVYWTLANGTAKYTALPTMMVNVNSNQATVNVPSAVTCSKGGKSVPMVITSSAIPYADITVKLETSSTVDGTKTTDHSAGITPNTNIVTIKIGSVSGILGFACSSDPKGTKLKYTLAGTDKAQFALSSAEVAVTAAKAGTKPASPKLTMTKGAASEASKTIIEGECAGMGSAWMQFAPAANKAAILGKVTDVTAAYAKFDASAKDLHTKEQWCYGAVTAAGQKTTCNFKTASNRNYTTSLYCETIEGWFFASKKVSTFLSADNGGKTVGLTLTYKKAINDITNNAVVLSVCGKIAETMAVPYSRVTDAYGGYYGNKSPSLPTSAPAAAKPAATTTTKTNTTAAKKTMRMLNTTANATAKVVEYKLNLFIQPDPFAKKADNAATIASATGTAATAAINSVTSASYGTFVAKAATVTENAVAWTTSPSATGGVKKITITGTTTVAGYVYCGMNKNPSRRFRMLNATANATNKTTTTAAKPAATSTVITNLQSSQAA